MSSLFNGSQRQKENLTPRNCQETDMHVNPQRSSLDFKQTWHDVAARYGPFDFRKNRSFFAHFVQKTRPYFSSVGGQLDPRRASGKQTSGNGNMYWKYFSDMFTPFLTISHPPEGQSVFLTAIHIGSTPSFQHFHDCWNMLHSVFLLHSIIMRKWSDEFHTKLLKAELQIGSGDVALHLKNQMIAKLKWI